MMLMTLYTCEGDKDLTVEAPGTDDVNPRLSFSLVQCVLTVSKERELWKDASLGYCNKIVGSCFLC